MLLCPRKVRDVKNANFMEAASSIYLLDQNPDTKSSSTVYFPVVLHVAFAAAA